MENHGIVFFNFCGNPDLMIFYNGVEIYLTALSYTTCGIVLYFYRYGENQLFWR